jgi:hypothetical protein
MPLFVVFVAAVFGIGALTASASHELSPAHFICIAH